MSRVRKCQRTKIHKKLQQEALIGENLIESYGPNEADEDYKTSLDVAAGVLSQLLARFETLSEEIAQSMEDSPDAELEEEVEFAADVSASIDKLLSKLSARQKSLNRKSPAQTADFQGENRDPLHSSNNDILQQQLEKLIELETLRATREEETNAATKKVPVNSVRIPPIQIDMFSGNIVKWKEFWDTFDAAINQNQTLRPVEKLAYLCTRLEGEAKSMVAGLETTNENYEVVVSLLQSRYGDIQALITAHYAQILELKPAPNNTAKLRALVDDIEKHFRCLTALGEDVNHRHFVSLVMSKLPRNVIIKLEEEKDSKQGWKLEAIRSKLQSLLSAREIAERQCSTIGPSIGDVAEYNSVKSFKPIRSYPGASRHTTTETLMATTQKSGNPDPPRNCIFCSGSHWNDQCDKFRTVGQRKAQLRNRCFVCLKQSHAASNCKVIKRCFHCGEAKRHHQSLCPHRFGNSNEASAVASEKELANPIEPCESDTESSSNDALLASGGSVLLQTATSMVSNTKTMKEVSCRILMDSGSHRSYISSELANKLKLQVIEKQVISVTTFSADKPKSIETDLVELNLRLRNKSSLSLCVNVVSKITGLIQRPSVDTRQLRSFLWQRLPLADPFPENPENITIDLLIGSDYYSEIISPEKIQLMEGLYLMGSKLGWLLTGRAQKVNGNGNNITMLVGKNDDRSLFTASNISPVDLAMTFNPSLEDFWTLETIGIKDSAETTDDDKAQDFFNKTVQSKCGRYYVKWPYKNDVYELPDNYSMCLGRFKSVVKRLSQNKDELKKYDDIIRDQIEKGIVEKVDPSNKDSDLVHYIPHHPVVTPQKNTTKVRIVYDASAKTSKRAKSLNECLLRGPIILSNLCGLLMRFRTYPIVLLSDIEKAFLQIGLQVEDRDGTRFFWLKNSEKTLSDDNMETYRFCRVPFGIISSPFLLSATIQHHLDGMDSPTATKIKENIYVDNVITGVNDVQQAVEFYNEAKLIFDKASMNLREWTSNSKEFVECLPKTDQVNATVIKVLGLGWNLEKDTIWIQCPTYVAIEKTVTKREILKYIASFFDPLGFFSPLILSAKLFLQTLWREKIEWDTHLGPAQTEKWYDIARELQNISSCEIPRLLKQTKSSDTSLHCFCDASGVAYATTVYLRISNESSCHTRLIFSKTRLSPKGKISIPRLELLAMLIGVRSLKFCAHELRLVMTTGTIWSDSKCVLYWLKSRKRLTTFVENRLKEIREATNLQFRYVKSEDNPADLASRDGTTADTLRQTFWWEGPPWLQAVIEEWPNDDWQIPKEAIQSAQTEMVSSKILYETSLPAYVSHKETASPFEIDESRYSSLSKLLRVTGWCFRFITKLRRKEVTTSNAISSFELAKSKCAWERYVQQFNFSDCYKAISDGESHDLINQLGLKLDACGLIRCHGRFSNSDLPEQNKFPKLLPRNCHYTELTIRLFHCKLLHAGVSHTLSQLRHEYWIPQGRSEVRKILSKCQVCRRWTGGPYKLPQMPPLPASRVSQSVPFSHVGIDYFGPLFIKDNITNYKKVWVCLFTCLTVRAIHLELVCDMTANEFILCFRRFIARRGEPAQIICDNAPQFKATERVIDSSWHRIIYDPTVKSYIASQRIIWKFIIAFAPWMGGFYERLIGVVKSSLRKTIGKLCFTNSQLQTVLSEVESVANSRPLTYVGEDNSSGFTICPADYTTINPNRHLPIEFDNHLTDPSFVPTSSQTTLLSLWSKGHMILNQYWDVWKDQYLHSLRDRKQTHLTQGRFTAKSIPHVRDVVIIKDENMPRGSWKIGVIHKLIRSQDDECRAAEVRFARNKHVVRPLRLLFPIECPDSREDLDQNSDEYTSDTVKIDGLSNDVSSATRSYNVSPSKPSSQADGQRPTRLAAAKAKIAIHGCFQG